MNRLEKIQSTLIQLTGGFAEFDWARNSFSEAGVESTQRSVKAILDWLEGMYLPEEAHFRYVGKPVSRMSVREDGASSVVMKYRLFHLIEDDWLTYYMTRIASNFQT